MKIIFSWILVLVSITICVAQVIDNPQFGVGNSLKLDGQIFRDNFGGAYYVRQIGNDVYWFAEHPDKNYAHVFKGTRNGTRISGQWWDVPKQGAKSKGTLRLKIEGQTIQKTAQTGGFGASSWSLVGIDVLKDKFPGNEAPAYGSSDQYDLTGVWDGNDGAKYYIRDAVGSDVVWYGEQSIQDGEQPLFANVFIGKRNGTLGRVSGILVDVPKGKLSNHGQISFNTKEHFRGSLLEKISGTGAVNKWYRTDIRKFKTNLERQFNNVNVGWGYAIYQHGKFVAQGGGGKRITSQDGGPRPFNANTEKGVLSTNKTITAVAVLQLLELNNVDPNTTKIKQFLPHHWEKGVGVNNLTFADLLSHRSKLLKPQDHLESIKESETIEDLELIIKRGCIGKNEYNNTNYALFRIIIPYLYKPALTTSKASNLSPKKFNEYCSLEYIDYINKFMMEPAGNPYITCKYRSSNRAYSYKHRSNAKGRQHTLSLWYRTGAGGIVMSAVQYARFLNALEGGKLLGKEMLNYLKRGHGAGGRGNTSFGQTYGHDGAITYSDGRGSISTALMMPNSIQLFMHVNSRNNTGGDNIEKKIFTAFEQTIKLF